MTLREEVELINQDLTETKRKYKEVVDKLYSQNKGDDSTN